ncbi:MAG: ABC transporter permease, partial [Candidatus Bathyarchaeia archaeon]
MGAYLIRRFLIVVPILLGVLTFAFFLMRLIPGDPVLVMLGPDAPPQAAEKLRRDLGLDKPVVIQYFLFMRQIFRGDLGTSIAFQKPVLHVIKE